MNAIRTIEPGEIVCGGEILVPVNFDGVVLEVQPDAVVNGLRIVARGPIGGKSIGVLCHGEARLENVTVVGLGTCFQIIGKDAQLRGCHALGATAGYGFVLDTCSNALLNGCIAEECWLDGFKARRLAFDCALMNCTARLNGHVYLATGKGAGDGLDCYAGAEGLYLHRFLSEYNHGNGIAIKSGPNNTQPDGRPSEITAVDCICRNNRAVGLAAYGDNDRKQRGANPLPRRVEIRGGRYAGNGWEGLYLSCDDSTASDFIAEGNQAAEQVVVERWCKNVAVRPWEAK